jgi:peroxiredoxin-like protein
MEVRSKVFTYRTAVKWTGQKKGEASAPGKPPVEVATPPEFKGHEGIWSPEDLFVAAVNACVMTTFLALSERAGLSFASYESEAEGRLEMSEGKFRMTAVTVRPLVTLNSPGDSAKALELLAKAEENCLITNSVRSTVSLEPRVR